MAHKEDPFHGRHQAPHCKQPWHVRPAERHRNAGHRLCPHGRALPSRHQRRHPFRVRAVRLPRSADGRLFYCQRLRLPQALHPQMHRAAAQDPAQALPLYCAGHHGAPRFHSPRSFRLVGRRHLRIGQGLRRFPVRPSPHGHLLRASVFLLRTHVVLSGSDAGVGASGRAARDLPRAVHNPRSRRRHPAWLGHHAGVGGPFLHRTGHGVAALPLHRLSGQEAPPFRNSPFRQSQGRTYRVRAGRRRGRFADPEHRLRFAG